MSRIRMKQTVRRRSSSSLSAGGHSVVGWMSLEVGILMGCYIDFVRFDEFCVEVCVCWKEIFGQRREESIKKCEKINKK